MAEQTKGHKWDVYLSGGASALALKAARGTPITSWELREDLWRAGYAYPVDDVEVFSAEAEGPPPPELGTWLAGVEPSADLGLVRARSAAGEAWVGLVAHPRVDVGTLPRAVDLHATVALPAVAEGKYRIADGNGRLIEGPLDSGWKSTLDSEGEWVFQVTDAKGVAAWFPVYVGLAPPLENLFPPTPSPLGPDVDAQVERYLAILRDAYGSAVWRRDIILDASARRLLTDPEATVGSVLRGLGVAEPHQSWGCTAPSVEACLDAIVWDPGQRLPILSADYTNVGIAAAVDGTKVKIRIVLSGG